MNTQIRTKFYEDPDQLAPKLRNRLARRRRDIYRASQANGTSMEKWTKAHETRTSINFSQPKQLLCSSWKPFCAIKNVNRLSNIKLHLCHSQWKRIRNPLKYLLYSYIRDLNGGGTRPFHPFAPGHRCMLDCWISELGKVRIAPLFFNCL
jgi:hypothetical protein